MKMIATYRAERGEPEEPMDLWLGGVPLKTVPGRRD